MSSLPQPTTLSTFPPNPNPNPNLAAAISAAATTAELKRVHARILRADLSPAAANPLLLRLALASPSLDYALAVFGRVRRPPPVLSNRLLRELSQRGDAEAALTVYGRMRREGVAMDRFSLPAVMKAAAKASALREGSEAHALAAKMGFDADPFVQTGLVRMYAGCRRIEHARLMFDKMSQRDVVAWAIMIAGYSQCGLFDDVFELYEEMKSSNTKPDEMIFSTILSACGRAGNLSYGKAVHDFIAANGLAGDSHLQSALVAMYVSCGSMDVAENLFSNMSSKNLVASTAMISGYSKIGRLKEARSIFDRMVRKDLISWSAMISGYAESDQPQESLALFEEMQSLGIRPDKITMVSVISACAHLGVLDKAKWIHKYADNNGFGSDLLVNNALIDMYAKCGSLERAKGVFETMPRKNVISWTSMITAFAIHGDATNALSLFNQMKHENIKPNGVTFVGVLYACAHAGLVEEGRKAFALMANEYNIAPKREHYGCLVDLFGRANLLREALEIVETMPMAPNVVIWGSLMAACRVHNEAELGEFAAKRVLELEPDHGGALVVLSNIYAKQQRWEEVAKVRNAIKDKGVLEEKGFSRIELNDEVHEFLMADRNHKQVDEIYEKLDKVVSELRLAGYVGSVLVDLDEEEKKEVVLWHSEKLALSYGLIGGSKDSRIQIVKNLRICEDCHSFMKFSSKVYGKEIVVRDRTRFHHFKDGNCTCNDYW